MSTKIALPNGCSCSRLSVFPKNWKTKAARLTEDWYICYRFYDPKLSRAKQRIIKGMNEFKTLSERRAATQQLIDNELNLLKNKSYNPIMGTKIELPEAEYEVNSQTPFIEALRAVHKTLSVGKYTKRDALDVINGVDVAAAQLGFSGLAISDVSRKHCKLILNHCGSTAHKFNKYRSYLMILFNELFDIEATEHDPLSRIKKRKTIKKIRLTLTKEERKLVNDHLFKNHYTFWRFMHIFFHSGSRESEMMMLKYEDIDLENQRFKITVRKGKEYREEWRTIKDIILPLWKEIMGETELGQYLFAKFLKPGYIPIKRDQITKRWHRYVKADPDKGGLGIKADFYSLKHSNLDEIADILSVKDASKAAGHTTINITKTHYLIHEDERRHKRLKEINNKFV